MELDPEKSAPGYLELSPSAISIGRKAVVFQGTIVVGPDEPIILRPLPNEPEFSVLFSYVFEKQWEGSTTATLVSSTETMEVRLTKKWDGTNRTSAVNVPFASDSETSFYLSYVFETFGPLHDHHVRLDIVIAREPK